MEKRFTKDMNLISPSGYAMPFELPETSELEILSNYGDQIEDTNEINHGVDFRVSDHTWLKALATGVVSGITSDKRKGFSITVNYPNYTGKKDNSYDVVYSNIKEALCNYGKNVKAGDNVAVCYDYVHIEVFYNGKEINPIDFLIMLRDNLAMNLQNSQVSDNPEVFYKESEVRTPFDAHKDEIDEMYKKFFSSYMIDLFKHKYQVPTSTEASLRGLLTHGANLGAYFEEIPSMLNPLGLGTRSLSLIGRIQTILTYDFLNYLALMHGIFLSSMSEEEKKKLLMTQ